VNAVVITRRAHMYLALFLMPWMLMYGLSAVVMNHREFFARYGGQRHPARYEVERQLTWTGRVSPDATPEAIARQILQDLGMDGAHWVPPPEADGPIVIYRADPIRPRRITYRPADGTLRIEREVLGVPAFLEILHRRRGYGQPYLWDDVWAISVDLIIVSIIFWSISGLWIWLQRPERKFWGAVSGLAGAALFVFFLCAI
jgi:hypothetical protein